MSALLASLPLGMLSGANLLFAVVLMPGLFHLLQVPATRSYAVHLLSLYYLFCGALSGLALILLFATPCADTLLRTLLSLVCVSYWLAWQQARGRLLLDSASERVQQLQSGLQVMNTAQWAVSSAVFIRLGLSAPCW